MASESEQVRASGERSPQHDVHTEKEETGISVGEKAPAGGTEAVEPAAVTGGGRDVQGSLRAVAEIAAGAAGAATGEEGHGQQSIDEVPSHLAPSLVGTYKTLAGIRRKLLQMRADKTPHTADDIRKYQQMVDAIDSKRADGIFGGSLKVGNIPPGQGAMRELMDAVYDLIGSLMDTSSEMNAEVNHIYKTLKGIARKLDKMQRDKSYSLEDLQHYQQMVDAIDRRRIESDGIFAGSKDNVPAGQAQCSAALAECYRRIEKLKETTHELSPEVRNIVNQLNGIKKKLEKVKDQPHTMAELRQYQGQLHAIERNRHEGVFAGSPQTRIPAGQAVCAELLGECYELLMQLKDTAVDALETETSIMLQVEVQPQPA
ncbi:hypothetical protein CBR_g19299 [Chara braunii]|uniref:Uncharacterized protein n=1 Tax=Chara braunii TaxID=69332 RepID=A0A388KXL0_CHABU|nr:hypothetical protein CBR_g19299 [Chara braunii]|eukprot:GBG74787.1 hypothetical protein CBR_g19299 [Chara braunii]